MRISDPKALYIHIPFCSKKCYYCDFVTFEKSDHHKIKYIEYILKELNFYPEFKYETIYFGGGTPSILDPVHIEKILKHIKRREECEITLEMNPENSSSKTLNSFYKLGINRLSIGCQTFDNTLLKKIGRLHNKEDIISSYQLARAAGFNNISLDLMFGLPGQNLEMVKNDIENVLNLNPEHISIYSLIWKEDTKFWDMRARGIIKEVEEEEEGAMYEYIIDSLKNRGYSHYEISSFSKKGFEGKHNLKYWKNESYVGIGMGAVGYIRGKRYRNYSKFKNYFLALDNEKFPREEEEIVDEKKREEDRIILGLRLLKEGIYLNEKDFVNLKKAKYLEEMGLLEKRGDNYFLTYKGIFLANEVFKEFI